MGRVPYWNISYGMTIDALSILAFAALCYGMYSLWKRMGRGRDRVPLHIGGSPMKIGPLYLRSFLTKGILGAGIYKKIVTGIAHGCVFWGMALLLVGTTMVLLNVVIGLPVFQGDFNRWFMGFTLDCAGIAVLAGTLFLLGKRLLAPDRLAAIESRWGFVPMEIGLVLIVASGFLLEGLRIANTSADAGAFVGNWLATSVLNVEDGLQWHRYVWWAHGLGALAFVGYIPFSPLVHLFLAPVNAGLCVPIPGYKLGNLDFSGFESDSVEELPKLGVSALAEFSKKRLLDFASCLWCGRCHEVCPAAQTQKRLSPKGVMVTLSKYFYGERLDDKNLVNEISSEAIFNCTTCAACLEACPVSVNQPKAILRMRQNLVMEQSEMPETVAQALKSLEARQHPFFGTASGKRDWCKGLDVPVFEQNKTEYLLWVGCSVTYEERAQKIGRAMVNILKKANVSFGILEEPRCTGDPAKQMGNEFLFQEIAHQNLDDFSSLGVSKIITICPHCYNSFTRDYPLLGSLCTAIPHSVFLYSLMDSGKIKVSRGLKTIAYHDPCYLGRHNRIFEEPRRVLSSAGRLLEMPRNKSQSFCCGAGGGNYWAEETGTRINQVRAKEALDTKADVVATACPFCLLMMVDGSKKFTEEQKVFDIAELIDAQS